MRQGQDYYIAAGTGGGWGTANFSILCQAQTFDAANDECTTAITITDGHTAFDNTGATNEQSPNLVLSPCALPLD